MPSSLFDQSALVAIAEELVAAARRAGADAAEAIAVRGVSQSIEVRQGTVEESERSEDDDVGLRVLVGRRQAVVSTNDLAHEGADALAERAIAMARVAPEDPFAGLADPDLLARERPELDLLDPDMPSVRELEERAQAAEAAALAVTGVTKSGGASASAGIGGMVLVMSTGFIGRYLGSRHSVSMQAIAGEGTAMERDYDYSSAVYAADLDSPEVIGRNAGERAVKRLNPRKVPTQRAPVIYHAQRGVSSTPSPGPSNVHLEPGSATPEAFIKDVEQGLYVTDLIGMGVNMVTGDYSRGAAGFWIERGELTFPVSEITIAGNLADMFRSLQPANDLTFRYGINAPTVRVEGLTIAGL